MRLVDRMGSAVIDIPTHPVWILLYFRFDAILAAVVADPGPDSA